MVGFGAKGNKDARTVSDEALLAELGYKQEFRREFTPLELFGVSFSIIGLLPSIASVLFYALPNGGPSAMVWGWAAASIFILLVGLSMAELGSAAPTSGGLYFWTHSLASPRYRNLLAWIVGYSNTIGTISAVASIAWGCAVQIMAAASIGNPDFTATKAQTYGVYCLILVTSTAICCLATRVLARLQTVYVIFNILLCFAVIVALPAATPRALMNDTSFALGNFSNLSDWPSGFAFILSFLAPTWTICSFDSAVHISEEASNAVISVPWAIVAAIAIAGVLGTAINISLAFCMGTDLSGIINSPIGQPMAAIFLRSFGKNGTLVLWAVVIAAQYFMGTSMLLASSRQVFAFSRDGALPFSRFIYRSRGNVNANMAGRIGMDAPASRATLFCAISSGALGLLAFAGVQAINAVFALSVAALYCAYVIPIACRFVFASWRSENGNEGRVFRPGPFNLGWFSLPCAILAITWMVFMIVVLMFPASPHVSGSNGVANMNYASTVFGGAIVLSLAYYYFPVYGGRYWFAGPIKNVDTSSEKIEICRDEDGLVKEEKGVEFVISE